MVKKIIFNWSSGKDSALALYELKTNPEYEILTLLTTVNEDYNRISMHGVRERLLDRQAESLDLPMEKIYMAKDITIREYEIIMKDKLTAYKNQNILHSAFGDIYLEDLKEQRESKLAKVGMKGIFPLWKRDTKELARRFLTLGFKAIVTCVDTRFLDKKFAGRVFDEQFLSELPPNVDPCGENGEFHSFVYAGPLFREKIGYEKGETVLRNDQFCFCDLIPNG